MQNSGSRSGFAILCCIWRRRSGRRQGIMPYIFRMTRFFTANILWWIILSALRMRGRFSAMMRALPWVIFCRGFRPFTTGYGALAWIPGFCLRPLHARFTGGATGLPLFPVSCFWGACFWLRRFTMSSAMPTGCSWRCLFCLPSASGRKRRRTSRLGLRGGTEDEKMVQGGSVSFAAFYFYGMGQLVCGFLCDPARYLWRYCRADGGGKERGGAGRIWLQRQKSSGGAYLWNGGSASGGGSWLQPCVYIRSYHVWHGFFLQCGAVRGHHVWSSGCDGDFISTG